MSVSHRPRPARSVFSGARVLITGGTGSFGNAFTRYLLARDVGAVCILSRDEQKQDTMRRALHDDHRLRFFLGDVRDLDRLRLAFRGVDVVLHAAALKIVPAVEADPIEGVKTNVLGSANVVRACIDAGVSRAVLLSTDKSCSPSTSYGATKLCAERMFVDGNAYAATRFAVTRYGNVLGSRGSIIPAWKALLATGAPLIVTDPASTRFAMQMQEAVALVALAAETMVGGEVFIPSLPAFSLADLIEAMAPDGYPVEVSGLRPAEKRHELLISADEAPQARECLDGYRLLPLRDWRGVGTPGVAVSEGFRYGSDTARRLSAEELRALVS